MKVKCRPTKCGGAVCCYNVPLERNELERFADKIVNPVLFTAPLGSAVVPFTNADPAQNRCPFLGRDYKCNIYENRPDVCRKFGEVPRMPCPLCEK